MATVHAVGPRVLRPSQYSLDTPVGEIERKGRLTVAFAFIYNNEQVLLVKPSEGKHWILPQGGVKVWRGETLREALFREAQEELNFELACLKNERKPVLLGEFLNPMPPERKVGEGFKHEFVVGVGVHFSSWVKLKRKENREHRWVKGLREFVSLISSMRDDRREKYQAMVDAIGELREKSLLSWTEDSVTA